MKKYQIFAGGLGVYDVEVERETEKSIWIGGKRHNKRSGWKNFFDTRAEAKKIILDAQTEKVRLLRKKLDIAERDLERANGLKMEV